MTSTVMIQGTSMQKISILAPLLHEWEALNQNLTLELNAKLDAAAVAAAVAVAGKATP